MHRCDEGTVTISDLGIKYVSYPKQPRQLKLTSMWQSCKNFLKGSKVKQIDHPSLFSSEAAPLNPTQEG